jgi:hypothetical protein
LKTVWIAFICGFFLGGLGVIHLLSLLPYLAKLNRMTMNELQSHLSNQGKRQRNENEHSLREDIK